MSSRTESLPLPGASDLASPIAGEVAAARWLLPTIAVLFFLSGLSGLIYQVLWLRLLGLVFGITVFAASAVLASFMAGLAIGSFLAGRFADRARRPLLWYGVAEVLVGLSALATPRALDAVERLYIALHPTLAHAEGALALGRFALASAVLIVPATLMGATLPLVLRSSLGRTEAFADRISLLYGTNTAGAIAGTLLAGFVLIGGIGIAGAFQAAAALNILVGIVAVIAVLLTPSPGRPADSAPVDRASVIERAPPDWAPSDRGRRVVLWIFALSGFASLALEVIWFRILALYLETTTYAFTVMLATFLLGITAGSFFAAAILKRAHDRLATLAVIEIGIAVAALGSLALVALSYGAIREAGPALRGLFGWDALGPLVIASFLALFPTTLLLGIAFPIGLSLWAAGAQGQAARAGEHTGLFYALNVAGAIAGSLVAGFVLLPAIGSRAGIILVSVIPLASGLALLALAARGGRRVALPCGAACVVFAVIAVALPDPFVAALASRYGGEQLLWRDEGVQTTVSVHLRSSGQRAMYVEGIHQASEAPGVVQFHRLVGLLPVLLHPDPTDALVIGLGGGATAGAVSLHPATEVDVVELSESVVRGADWFTSVNYGVLGRPNVSLRIDDGRNFMLLTSRRYDVVTADIIPPHIAAAGNLYSAEYFRIVRAVLEEDGVMAQWVSGSTTQYSMLARTFQHVFPHTTLWSEGRLLIGSKQPLQLDRAAIERRLADPAFREVVATVGIGSVDDLLAMYNGGPEEIRRYVGDGPLVTDDRPVLEYFLSLPRDDTRPDLNAMRGEVDQVLAR